MSDQDLKDIYDLDAQIGFVLRKAHQSYTTTYAEINTSGLTPQQFSTLYRLATEPGPISQNALGRLVAMDAATTKGVVQRLKDQGLIETKPDQVDRRRYIVSTTEKGRALLLETIPTMINITRVALEPLDEGEARTLLNLLRRIT
ncbi:MarR family winged helix-turn-helix transcriptional regulator [Epibacterium ulvae]|uniref:MarR family winged helix-turn-helix transcriptional regulator n=1 Tax=Epibacterium ulvae TaxID=1156985 RepID=UPI001BFC0987|nr:MarR family winged helix-turn-helix transcriptional regulator [Epibacterium ulvae]MBT8152679.1 MarR family winged helix-turn-helix transcriptional regulator [Epibacterium ulvae]